ncbi:MAG: hypothetical protein HC802_09765 [Caldilineaceae bacterium]|nr:hypothetical protein [Caldilineaceae bacterium]
MYEVGFRGGFFTVIYLPLMVSGLAVGYMAVMLFRARLARPTCCCGNWG